MVRRSIAAVALAAAALVSGAAPAGAAPAPCRSSAGVVDGPGLLLVITGHYVAAPTSNVELTCHVVQEGVIVASTTDQLVGGVAVVADTVEVSLGAFQVCYEVSVRDFSGWGGNSYDTNCP